MNIKEWLAIDCPHDALWLGTNHRVMCGRCAAIVQNDRLYATVSYNTKISTRAIIRYLRLGIVE